MSPISPASTAGPTSVSAQTPLDGAISAWTQVRSRMTTSLGQLESAILAAFVGEAPTLITDLQRKVTKVSGLAHALDPSLADALNKAKSAGDSAAHAKALSAARVILEKFRNYVKAQEKFLSQIDANPFGVKTNLKQELSSGLDQVSKVLH